MVDQRAAVSDLMLLSLLFHIVIYDFIRQIRRDIDVSCLAAEPAGTAWDPSGYRPNRRFHRC